MLHPDPYFQTPPRVGLGAGIRRAQGARAGPLPEYSLDDALRRPVSPGEVEPASAGADGDHPHELAEEPGDVAGTGVGQHGRTDTKHSRAERLSSSPAPLARQCAAVLPLVRLMVLKAAARSLIDQPTIRRAPSARPNGDVRALLYRLLITAASSIPCCNNCLLIVTTDEHPFRIPQPG